MGRGQGLRHGEILIETVAIEPRGKLEATVRPPGSKSITNRALVCAALADGRSSLEGVLRSDDTEEMVRCLGEVGIRIETRWDRNRIVVHGCRGQLPAGSGDLFVGNSGTTIRFLTAMVSLARGKFTLSGVPRMSRRPIGDLVEALNQLGGNVSTASPGRCPPVHVKADGLAGGEATLRGDTSSQYLSALLMAAPYARAPVRISVQGPLVSRPFVDMTREVMKSFGGTVLLDEKGCFTVGEGQRYVATDYTVEPDASSASYFWAAAAIAGGSVTVSGLDRDSIQGDVRFVDLLREMGCSVESLRHGIRVTGPARKGIEADMNDISDTVQTLAAVAVHVSGPTTIRGVAHIRHKETDRLGHLARELGKLGVRVEEFEDGLRINPGAMRPEDGLRINPGTIRPNPGAMRPEDGLRINPGAMRPRPEDGLRINPGAMRPTTFETYDDHRMAMSLALIGLRLPGIRISNPRCVAKTFPGFFERLGQLEEAG